MPARISKSIKSKSFNVLDNRLECYVQGEFYDFDLQTKSDDFSPKETDNFEFIGKGSLSVNGVSFSRSVSNFWRLK